jgi:hypothetical protein
MIERYGVTWADGVTDALVELRMAFDVREVRESLHGAPGFLGAFTHLQRAIDLIWNRYEKPLLIWNEWSEMMLDELIQAYHKSGEIVFTGPSASWKSTCVACFIVSAWLADPLQTKCPISSTNLGSLRELLWKDVYKFYRTSQPGFGNVVQHPKPKIQTVKGDDSMGIFGVAVKQGDVEDVIEQIKGRHAPKVIVGIDEGPGALQAVVDACVNLRTGCEKFLLIMLGNANSYFDQHGRLSEPEAGWSSVSVESEKWRTKRGGTCIHLDGHKAPNVILGFKKYPGMISQEDLDVAKSQYGDNSPRYWQERRGFWPPEGLTKTVLTAAMIEKFHARDEPVWVSEPDLVASLDPAFEGGDRRVLRFGKVGLNDSEINGNRIHHRILCPTEILCLKVDITSKEPIHYQIARQTREECKARGVEADHFALDSTGEGGGIASIFKREWSEDILEVEFGGYASQKPISDINPRLGREEYANRVTELWFQFRNAVEKNQIRGLDVETAKEFCQRNVDYERYAPRSIVESKGDMKGLRGKSPDFADALVVMTELCLVRGWLPSSGTTVTGKQRQENWLDFAKKMTPRNKYETKAA